MTAETMSRDAAQRQFRRAFRDWPSYLTDSSAKAEKAFMALSDEDRLTAAARVPDYLAEVGQKCGSFGDYLREKRWERLGASPASRTEKPTLHKPFSKAWQALALSILLGPEASLPRMTVTMARIVEQGGSLGDRYRRDHRTRWAWPRVISMYQARHGELVPADIARASEGFRSYGALSEQAEAWRRLYHAMGWPWPEMSGDAHICFPSTEDGSDAAVDAALEEFKQALAGHRGDDDAA